MTLIEVDLQKINVNQVVLDRLERRKSKKERREKDKKRKKCEEKEKKRKKKEVGRHDFDKSLFAKNKIY